MAGCRRTYHLNQLVRVDGVVTRRTGVFPQLQQVKYDCPRCSAVLGPFFQSSEHEIKLGSCPNCEYKGRFEVRGHEAYLFHTWLQACVTHDVQRASAERSQPNQFRQCLTCMADSPICR